MLRPSCDLEPDSALVLGEAPAVAERVDQEEAAPALLGGALLEQLGPADALSGIGDLAAHTVATRVERDLDRPARAVADRIRHEVGDDHLHAPAVVRVDSAARGRFAYRLTRTRRCVWRRRQLQGN